MAQGKLKVKSKLPENMKNKKTQKKGSAVTKRANRPVQPKKKKGEEVQKLKQAITKTVIKKAEEEMRLLASRKEKNLSKAQQAVASHHSKTST